MKLAKYIKVLQELHKKHGDCLLFTSVDDEGNGYNIVHSEPEVRFLSPHDDIHHPDSLVEDRVEEDETLEEWLENNYIDEEDIPKLKKVILL